MAKIQQTQEELENHLNEQLHFLEVSAENFDKGDDTEAKRMVVPIRTLLHDTSKSQSLLKLLGLKDKVLFIDSSSSEEEFGTYAGLVLKSIGSKGGSYVAPLDDVPPNYVFKKVSFNDYWDKDIFIDNKGNHFSRKKLILAIANKDGGAHIDPELDQEYNELTKENSLGWIYGNSMESGPLENASFAAVRQITHEVLKTLISNYPEKKLLNSQNSVVLGGIHLTKGMTAGFLVGGPKQQSSFTAVGRNEKCPCDSGIKYKKCHGK